MHDIIAPFVIGDIRAGFIPVRIDECGGIQWEVLLLVHLLDQHRLPDGPTHAETDDIGAQLAAQTAAIEELSELIEQLIDELRAGR